MARKKNKKPKLRVKKIKIIKSAKRGKVLNRKPKTKKQKAKPKLKTKNKNAKQRKPFKKGAAKTATKIRRAGKRKIKTDSPKNFPAETFFKARIKVVGVGGGGGSIVSEIGRSLEKATFVVADTDIRALKKKASIKYFWFGEELTRGLGTGVNIDLAKQAAESAKEKISGIFKDQDIIIFIASLGGGLGSGATQIFAEEARKFGAITFGIFTLPFKFEGRNKARIAQNSLRALRQCLNVSLTIPNEKIFKIIDESTPITTAFSVVNKSLTNSLESLIDLIYSPGIINIDFADLRTILKGRGNLAFLNTIEESGKNRAEKICEKTFVNPLLQGNMFGAEKILFNITGSDNLSMFEVEKISSHIAKSNPKAKIIFGISKSPKLKNKIKTTILMTGGGIKEEIREKPAEQETAEVKAALPEKPVFEPTGQAKKPAKKIGKKELSKKKFRQGHKKPKTGKSKEGESKEYFPRPKADEAEIPVFGGVPTFKEPVSAVSAGSARGLNIIETFDKTEKNIKTSKRGTIRRSGLEIKKAEEQEEKKKIDQEKEWEIPAFLRRVKFNK